MASPKSATPCLAQDGTGHEILATGVQAQGIEFTPAPSSVAVLGLGDLITQRRRR